MQNLSLVSAYYSYSSSYDASWTLVLCRIKPCCLVNYRTPHKALVFWLLFWWSSSEPRIIIFNSVFTNIILLHKRKTPQRDQKKTKKKEGNEAKVYLSRAQERGFSSRGKFNWGKSLLFQIFSPRSFVLHKNHARKTQWLVRNKPLVNPPVRSSRSFECNLFVLFSRCCCCCSSFSLFIIIGLNALWLYDYEKSSKSINGHII